MISKIVAIQGNHPSKLNHITDTTIFLANEIQNKGYNIFYYDPKNLSVIFVDGFLNVNSSLVIVHTPFHSFLVLKYVMIFLLLLQQHKIICVIHPGLNHCYL